MLIGYGTREPTVPARARLSSRPLRRAQRRRRLATGTAVGSTRLPPTVAPWSRRSCASSPAEHGFDASQLAGSGPGTSSCGARTSSGARSPRQAPSDAPRRRLDAAAPTPDAGPADVRACRSTACASVAASRADARRAARSPRRPSGWTSTRPRCSTREAVAGGHRRALRRHRARRPVRGGGAARASGAERELRRRRPTRSCCTRR